MVWVLIGDYCGIVWFWILMLLVGLIVVLFLLCIVVILCVHVVDVLAYSGCYFDVVLVYFSVKMAK